MNKIIEGLLAIFLVIVCVGAGIVVYDMIDRSSIAYSISNPISEQPKQPKLLTISLPVIATFHNPDDWDNTAQISIEPNGRAVVYEDGRKEADIWWKLETRTGNVCKYKIYDYDDSGYLYLYSDHKATLDEDGEYIEGAWE